MYSARSFFLVAVVVGALGCSKKNAEPVSDGNSSTSASSTTSNAASIASANAAFDAGPGLHSTSHVNVTVERRLAALRPRLYACYQKILAGKPTEAGDVTVKLTIGTDGLVKNVEFTPTALSNDTLDCMKGAVEKTQFGELEKESTYGIPMAFSPPKDGRK